MHVAAFIGLLLAVVSCAESRQQKLQRSKRYMLPPRWPYPGMNNTAAGLYNSATEKCCLGSVHPNKKPAYDKCCGSDMFDKSKQRCCNGTIVPLVPGEECCGQKTINTDTAICCDGEIVEMDHPEDIPFAKPCGKKAYNVRSQTCCSTGTEFNILEGTDLNCCGDTSYETGKEVCCVEYEDGKNTYRTLPTSDASKTTCCGDTVYDPNKEYCCGEKVVAVGRLCCGDDDYDLSTDVCCNNQLKKKNRKNLACCGDNFYDMDDELCAYEVTADGQSSQTVVTKTDPKQSACCGLEPYNTVDQLCCYETKKVITKSNQNHYQCCGDVSYGYSDGVCCNNKLLPLSASKSCCGTSLEFDQTSQLCCGAYDTKNSNYTYAVVEKAGENQCCGLKIHNKEKELCCGDQIFPKSDNAECCGTKPYNKETEVCCSYTTAFPKENDGNTCCLYGTTDEKPGYPYCYPYEIPPNV